MAAELATPPRVRAWTAGRPNLGLYRLLQRIAAPLIRAAFATRRTGHRTLPRNGPVILVSNHCSNLDPVLVVGCVGRPLFHLAKDSLFTTPNRARFFQTLGGQIPIDRQRGGNEAAIDAAVRCLEQGQAFAIYPEGARSLDGRVQRGHTGVARIAVRTGAPVYPVAIDGTFTVWPKGQKFPRLFRRTRIIVGPPRTYPRQPALVDNAPLMRRITDEVMGDVARLLGQEYFPQEAGPPGAGPD